MIIRCMLFMMGLVSSYRNEAQNHLCCLMLSSRKVDHEGADKELIEMIAKAIVDNPDQVQVRAIEGEQVIVFELRVHPSDLGKVIGRQGRTAESICIILAAAGMKLRKRITLEILD
jgi:uncharacterized protein